MENRNIGWCLGRVLIAFFISPIIATMIYTIMAFGRELFFPIVFFVGAGAMSVTVLVFIPIYLIMVWRKWFGLWQMLVISFLAGMLLFFSLFFYNDMGMNAMGAGGKVFVENGKLTIDGYVNLSKRSLLAAFSCGIAGLVFWFIAHCGRDDLRKFQNIMNKSMK